MNFSFSSDSMGAVMRFFRNFLLVISIFFSATMLSGCELLVLPFKLIVYILGGTVAVVMRLLPIAAKLLPLALLFVQAEQPKNQDGIVTAKKIDLPKFVCDNRTYPDGFKVISEKLDNDKPEQFNYIFMFDPKTPKDKIVRKIRRQLNKRKLIKIDSCLVNGASFYNEKYRFFMLLDKLRKKGVLFKGFGPMKDTVTRFNNQGRV